ncbi:DUF669 domain-containing protein [Bacillus hominis]|uniref:Uncharacterized protein DUF669 n=2 Tax=Bacillus cereus group TaxID=86661 RepID=A0A4R4BM86_BACTU|nr:MULTISPECIES: DUF669 domain-containing protein [Bacillus cereus group]MDM5439869.1 DUF669 domain-containing protein [Bacillus hominis]TCW58981.1 uncharacterized protein DUF669 [Bacillus thuringiensis]TCW59779.1 uncharacterized protein DUF669 [Bacillus thuringiensis]
MSFFKMDEVEEVKGFSLIEVGNYEVVVLNAVEGLTQNSKPKLTVDFEIRSDVPQDHQGQKVQYTTFTFEHPVARGIAKSFLLACGMPESYSPQGPAQMAKDVFNKHLNVYITHDKKDDGRVFPKVSSYSASKVNPPMQTSAPVTVGDDDLPF